MPTMLRPIEVCRTNLASLIMGHALRFGDFTLASGQKSTYFIDMKMVTLTAIGAFYIGRVLLDMLPQETEAVGGMSIGADPIAGAVITIAGLQCRDLQAFLIRKEVKDHGTRKQVEGPLSDGARVVMLEDVTTTGGSTLQAIAAVEREKKAQVIEVITLVDRLQGAKKNLRDAGYSFRSVFTIEELGVVIPTK